MAAALPPMLAEDRRPAGWSVEQVARRLGASVREYRASEAGDRARLDPYDPSTFRHAPECEQRDTTDPTILRAILKVSEREGYWWVECGACDCGWQVAYYAA